LEEQVESNFEKVEHQIETQKHKLEDQLDESHDQVRDALRKLHHREKKGASAASLRGGAKDVDDAAARPDAPSEKAVDDKAVDDATAKPDIDSEKQVPLATSLATFGAIAHSMLPGVTAASLATLGVAAALASSRARRAGMEEPLLPPVVA